MNPESVLNWIKMNTKLVIAFAVVAVLVLIGLGIASYKINVTNQGEGMQENIEQLFKESQNSLSTCIDQGNVAAQVTTKEFEALHDILADVASARYTDASGKPTNASGVLGGGQLISALSENYPQIDQTSWQNLSALVIGCRTNFQGAQDKLFYFANDFEKWQLNNDLFNTSIKSGFPSDQLDVVDIASGQSLRGQAALDYITRVISVKAASEAFATGELGEQDLFG